MQLIHLNGKNGSVVGKFAMVDDEDFEFLNQWQWRCTMNNSRLSQRFYAVRDMNKYKSIPMHRIILNIQDKKLFGDHINGNGLDNRRENLRIATHSQNMANRSKKNGINYLGINRVDKNTGVIYYVAQLQKDKIRYRSKAVRTELEAAILYNELAIKHHGEFARLNVIPK